MKTYFHPEQLLHHPRSYLSRGQMREPQEVPERAARLVAAVRSLDFDVREPADRGTAPIAAVHDMNYLRFLEEAHRDWKQMPDDWGDEVMSNVFVRDPNQLRGVLAKAARYLADGSCPVGANTWRAAYWSAQGALAAAADVNDGAREAYALCRPPGHHARRDAAGGFCYLNNAAIAAQSLLGRHRRVAILDTDMHHGQGVQEIFYGRDDVLYVSIHGDPTTSTRSSRATRKRRARGPATASTSTCRCRTVRRSRRSSSGSTTRCARSRGSSPMHSCSRSASISTRTIRNRRWPSRPTVSAGSAARSARSGCRR